MAAKYRESLEPEQSPRIAVAERGAPERAATVTYSFTDPTSDPFPAFEMRPEKDIDAITAIKIEGQRSGGPIMPAVGYLVVKLLVKFLVLAEIMEPLALDILNGIINVVEYYLRAVYVYFGRDMKSSTIVPDEPVSQRVIALFTRLKEMYPEVNSEGRILAGDIDGKCWLVYSIQAV